MLGVFRSCWTDTAQKQPLALPAARQASSFGGGELADASGRLASCPPPFHGPLCPSSEHHYLLEEQQPHASTINFLLLLSVVHSPPLQQQGTTSEAGSSSRLEGWRSAAAVPLASFLDSIRIIFSTTATGSYKGSTAVDDRRDKKESRTQPCLACLSRSDRRALPRWPCGIAGALVRERKRAVRPLPRLLSWCHTLHPPASKI